MRVAIVGAGFSGTLLAIHLLHAPGVAVTLIERAEDFGRGLAYGAADPDHLLNVRASNMSAFPGEPDHFLRWLATTDAAAPPSAFVSRRVFGSYLQSLLRTAVEGAAGRFELVGDEAVALEPIGPVMQLRFAMGHAACFDKVVLATGNLPPHDPPGLTVDVAGTGRYVRDPWAPAALAGIGQADDVLLVGTGLTAMDIVTKLIARGHDGRITAISRRGLRPRAHRDGAPPPPPDPVPGHLPLSALVRLVRTRAAASGDWHLAVDSLRGSTAAIWHGADLAQRRRFLRHLRPWWDVHRHRLAPAVATALEDLEERGRFAVHGGEIKAFDVEEDGFSVCWRPRHGRSDRTLRVGHVVNCTGPSGDLATTRSRLLLDLVARELARPDACGLGLDVDAQCRLRDAAGASNSALLAIGPASRGTFWEITAVPDIRVQAAALAGQLTVKAERMDTESREIDLAPAT